MAQKVKNLTSIQVRSLIETRIRSLCQEDPLEKAMATQSSILAWRIPWTEEYGSLQFMDRTEQLTLSVKTKVTEMTLRKPGWKGTQS